MKQALLPVIAVGLFAAGETLPSDLSWVRAVANLGGTGVLAWFCWYGLTRAFPKMLETHRGIEEAAQRTFKEESTADREHQRDIVTSIMDRHREDIKEMAEQVVKMRAEVATCKVKRGSVDQSREK